MINPLNKLISRINKVTSHLVVCAQDAFSVIESQEIPPFIAVTTGGPSLQSLRRALRSAESCAWATGLATYVISHRALSRYPECQWDSHLKMRVFDLFPEAISVLYFAPSVLFLHKIDVRIYEDSEAIFYSPSSLSRLHLCDMILSRIPFEGYFTSDLFVISKKQHSTLLSRSRDLLKANVAQSMNEEVLLNRARIELDISTRSMLPLASCPVDPYSQLAFERAAFVRLQPLSQAYSKQSECLYAQLSPAFNGGRLGKLDRTHLVRKLHLRH